MSVPEERGSKPTAASSGTGSVPPAAREAETNLVPPSEARTVPSRSPTDGWTQFLPSRREGDPGPSSSDALGRYRPVGLLGEGGMGRVLEAEDPDLKRTVAIKTLRDEPGSAAILRERFLAEAQITGQLEHPNIVPIHEIGTAADGDLYFSMKKVRGVSLAERLAEFREKVGPQGKGHRGEEFLRDFLKVLEGVAFAHSQEVIHRDLKPANIMLGAHGEVLVMDWGLAKRLGGEEIEIDLSRFAVSETADPQKTQEGTIQGTPCYMPPEQAAGKAGRIDRASDIYSLGAILYEILTLHPPYQGESILETLDRVKEGPPRLPRERASEAEIPFELEGAVLKAMARLPEDRYPSVDAFHADLVAYLEGRTLAAATYHPLQRAAKWVRRHRVVSVAAVVVLMSSIGFWGYSEYQRSARELAVHEVWVAKVQSAVREVAGLEPERLLHRARESRARWVGGDDSPGLVEKKRLAEQVKALSELAQAWAVVLRLDPGNGEARQGRYDVLLEQGSLAQIAEDFTLAEISFREASSLGVDEGEADDRRREVDEARSAHLRRAAEEIGAILAKARRGDLDAGAGSRTYEDAKIDLLGYRERQTVDLLLAEIGDLTACLRESLREELSRREVPPGLRDSWLATQTPEGGGSPELEDQINHNLHRPGLLSSFDGRFVEVQREALREMAPGAETLLRLVCETLGYLGDREGTIEALGLYLWSEHDESRAVPAGRSILRLQRPEDEWMFEGLVESHFQPRGEFYRRVVRGWVPAVAKEGEGVLRSASESIRRGRSWIVRKEFERAIEDFNRAIELDPNSIEAYCFRGEARRRNGDLDGALEDYGRAIEIDPAFAPAHRGRGVVRGAGGDRKGALEDYGRALDLDPQDVWAYLFRGRVHLLEGALDAAMNDFERAIRLDDRLAAAHVGRGRVLFSRGELNGAFADFERAIAIEPEDGDAYRGRGDVHLAREEWGEAIEAYDRAVGLNPRDARAHIGRAMARARTGDLEGGIDDCERAIDLDPEIPRAYLNRGIFWSKMGDRVRAVADYDRALELDPQWGDAYLKRANARMSQGDIDGALEDYDRSLEFEPGAAKVHLIRGSLRESRGDRVGAVEDYDRAIQIDPDFSLAYYHRGRLHGAGGEFDRAREDLDRSIGICDRALREGRRIHEMDPFISEALRFRGIVRQRGEDADGAIEDFSRAVVADPGNALAYANRAILLEARGDLRGAVDDFERALEVAPRNWGFRREIEGRLEKVRPELEER